MTSLSVAFDILARDKASKEFEKVSNAAKKTGISGKAAGLALAAGFTAVGLAAKKFASSSVAAFEDTASQVKSLQRISGGSVKDVSRLAFAVKESGVSSDSFAGALRRLSIGLTHADKAGKPLITGYKYQIQQVPYLVKGHIAYHDVLKKVAITSTSAGTSALNLGFAYKDAHGKVLPMAELLPKLADKFKTLPDGAEKTALAIKLFGKQGTELLPFLNKGSAGIAELEKESDRLGHTLSGRDLDAIKQNAAAHKQLHAAVEGLQIQVGRLLLPVLAKFAAFSASVLVPILASVTNFISTKVSPAFSAFIQGLEGSKKATFFTQLGADARAFEKQVVTTFDKAKAKVSAFFQGFTAGPNKTTFTGPKGRAERPEALTGAASLGAQARTVFDDLRAAIKDKVIPAVAELIKNIGSLARTMAENLFPILRDVVAKLFDARAIILPIAAAFLAINAAITVTTNVLDTIKAVTEGYTKAVETLIAVKKFFITTTDAETGAVTLSGLAQLRLKAALVAVRVATLAQAAATFLLDGAMAVLASPITVVIAAIAALAIGLIYAYNHSKTFRDIVQGAFHLVAEAADFVRDHIKIFVAIAATLIGGPLVGAVVLIATHFTEFKRIVAEVLAFVVNRFLGFIGFLINGAAEAFGWIPGIGPKLKALAKDFQNFANRVQASLAGIHPPPIVLQVRLAGPLGTAAQAALTAKLDRLDKPRRAIGGRVSAGTAYTIGEFGPETFVPNVSGAILNRDQARRALGGAGGTTFNLTVNNPVAEPASDSVGALRRVGFLLGA
ncbi:MAG: hypothetical protein ACXVGE_22090 [Blastococcus sp.]